jgi:hypothetical protein
LSAAHSPAPAFERHYTPQELAEMWNLSDDTIRAVFAREPGVLIFMGSENNKVRSRRYRTMRIPESVALRVYARSLSVAPAKR